MVCALWQWLSEVWGRGAGLPEAHSFSMATASLPGNAPEEFCAFCALVSMPMSNLRRVLELLVWPWGKERGDPL